MEKKRTRLTLLEEDSDSAVDQNTLLHGESLFVVTTSNSESVTLELLSQNLSIDIRAHSPVIEVATTTISNATPLTLSCHRQYLTLFAVR